VIACPKCGSKTIIKETRGNKRLRWCIRFECDGRVTTREVDANAFKRIWEGEHGGD
jgi:DNA-directed RNA polymerase subunit RPC12/RpoP